MKQLHSLFFPFACSTLIFLRSVHILSDQYLSDWNSIITHRPLAGLILEGIIGREADRTILDAQQDADHVAEALRIWPVLQEGWVAERNARREKTTTMKSFLDSNRSTTKS